MHTDWGPAAVAVVMFILMSPGLLFQLPARTRVIEFGNMYTSGISILVHAVLYFCIYTILVVAIGIHIRTWCYWFFVLLFYTPSSYWIRWFTFLGFFIKIVLHIFNAHRIVIIKANSMFYYVIAILWFRGSLSLIKFEMSSNM